MGVARTPNRTLHYSWDDREVLCVVSSDFVAGRAAWREHVGSASETEEMGGQILFLLLSLEMQTIVHLASRYNPGYTSGMKTAISIPEELFESAEEFARWQGISRSELYTTALRRYLEEQRAEMITGRLDEIYSQESDGLDRNIARLQVRSLPEDDW
jgi:hypothetical protein